MTEGAWTGEVDDMPMMVDRTAGWLPARSSRMIHDEDRRERQAARAEARERADRAEAAHNRAVASWRQQQEAAGDYVAVTDMLSGNAGVTIADVLERARVQSEAQDAYAERWRPGGHKPDEVMFTDLMPEPAPAARSETGRELSTRLRHFRDRVSARRKAEDLGVADLPRPDSRRSAADEGYQGMRSRSGGPIVGAW